MTYCWDMTDTERTALDAADAAINLLGLYADEADILNAHARRHAAAQWREARALLSEARALLSEARRVCDDGDAEVFERMADMSEALASCEYALRLGSAAPVAEVA